MDEETLSPEEQKERKIMKLLLKIKNGTPPMRKVSLFYDEERDFLFIFRSNVEEIMSQVMLKEKLFYILDSGNLC